MFLVQNSNVDKGFFKVKLNYTLCQPQVGEENEWGLEWGNGWWPGMDVRHNSHTQNMQLLITKYVRESRGGPTPGPPILKHFPVVSVSWRLFLRHCIASYTPRVPFTGLGGQPVRLRQPN